MQKTVQVVIKIPEREYKVICENNYVAICACPNLLSNAIKNGTVLPEKHGRLIDADDIGNIVRPIQSDDEGWAVTGETAIRLIHDAFNRAPTILEADMVEPQERSE